jgi:hypothetical protein
MGADGWLSVLHALTTKPFPSGVDSLKRLCGIRVVNNTKDNDDEEWFKTLKKHSLKDTPSLRYNFFEALPETWEKFDFERVLIRCKDEPERGWDILHALKNPPSHLSTLLLGQHSDADDDADDEIKGQIESSQDSGDDDDEEGDNEPVKVKTQAKAPVKPVIQAKAFKPIPSQQQKKFISTMK